MKPEEMTERLGELFDNDPDDNVKKLPEDVQKAFATKAMKEAEGFIAIVSNDLPLEVVIAGAISQAFFAGHEYCVRYGNFNADMREE